MALIKCKSCGNMISDKAVKCPKCGCTTTKEREEPVLQKEPQVQPVYKEEGNKANSKKALYATIGVLVAVLAVVGLWMCLSEPRSDNGSDRNVSDNSIDDVMGRDLDGTYQLRGEIGPYGAKMSITIDGKDVTGMYHYDSQKAGVNMSLSGELKKDKSLIINEYAPNGKNSGRFKGTFNGNEFRGTFYNLTNGNQFFFMFIEENNIEENKQDSAIPAGLTFRTFTKNYKESGNTIQLQLANEAIVYNLKKLGFDLIDRTTESRPDYTGEDYYEVTVETFSKAVNGNVTTVKLESEYTEIHFPNLNDVEEFKKTVRDCGLKETEDGFMDSEDIYWAGTDVSIKGTIVTLCYKSEP